MALTEFQRAVCRLIADNRIASGESYVAGGVALNELIGHDRLSHMNWTFPQMIAHVSDGEDVYPGDVYGSGTPFGGCGLDNDRWLQPGDVVELEVEGIGTLKNRVIRAS